MKAIHLRAKALSDWSVTTIQTVLARLSGVAQVATLKSAGIVSVLFDETAATAEQILSAIRAAGVEVVLVT